MKIVLAVLLIAVITAIIENKTWRQKFTLLIPDSYTIGVIIALIAAGLGISYLFNRINWFDEVTPLKLTLLVGFSILAILLERTGLYKKLFVQVGTNDVVIIGSRAASTNFSINAGGIAESDEGQGLRSATSGPRGKLPWEDVIEKYNIFDPIELPVDQTEGTPVNDRIGRPFLIRWQILCKRSRPNIIRLHRLGEKTVLGLFEKRAERAIQIVMSQEEATTISGNIDKLRDLSQKFEVEFLKIDVRAGDGITPDTLEGLAKQYGLVCTAFIIAGIDIPTEVEQAITAKDRVKYLSDGFMDAVGKGVPAEIAGDLARGVGGLGVNVFRFEGAPRNMTHFAPGALVNSQTGQPGQPQQNQNQGRPGKKKKGKRK